MTTIAVVRKGGFAAIASDTLTRCGSVMESARYVVNHRKIVPVGEYFVAITGTTSLKLAVSEHFQSLPEPAPLGTVVDIFRTWLVLHEALKDRYGLNCNEGDDDAVESTRLDALLAGPHGIFGVGRDRTVQEFTRFAAYGGGRDLALGAMYAVYDLPDRSAEDIARTAVEAAAEFDAGTGLPVLSHSVALK